MLTRLEWSCYRWISGQDAFEILNGATFLSGSCSTTICDEVDQKRLVCYDLLSRSQPGEDCPKVLDARRKYPFYLFVGGRGWLKIYLKFTPSSDSNANPWVALIQKEWTSDAYRK
jgi:hypothetical protein